jgi:hypothetical protein
MPLVMLLYRIDPQRPALGYYAGRQTAAQTQTWTWQRGHVYLLLEALCRFALYAILSPSQETALTASCRG